ncbi:MAG: TIGR03032 family protein [Pseudomonadales bacterium]|uniref:TIGR03032 family protein n=1 Tax=unclassified Ketobacter TaxID=2639109 RepID=UPI000C99319A|nr:MULTISPECIES: TIGR03032 family protein [unclassified Ketobacter]MAA58899.1 TIGR03032 family protein [Pseudomonadales bacterium]MEC8813212.1 TIGR03032 family protein [Pseudomonadota bacterium]HAG92897.1 TIGR03032 family protein [Gammaproteobacteria bacterium]MAQ23010.1 TIGR03032 family protein [Pseudomonadales bacterium]MAQ25989.1 TIGR03032 family protein [Pseudomonadales bacterium]|tara:strand:+ start:359 stop:1564 length:1206 start_codon:yes stop_codon:yes gene_type:complete
MTDPVTQEMDFSCQYSSNLPQVLQQLNISLAFTSYQAGRLMVVRSDGQQLDVNFKSFPRPMGLVATDEGLTLGIFTQVLHFQREDGLLPQIKRPLAAIEEDITAPRLHSPAEPETESATTTGLTAEQQQEREAWQRQQEALLAPLDQRIDGCYISRSAHYTGMINIHDIDWGDEGLWVVNSSFSCLCTLEPDYSFVPRWKPHFISELVAEDRCHLNGMTLRDGKPAYVTTFSTANEKAHWRKGAAFDGTVMDVEHNEILLRGLVMPHSPRWYNDRLYFCNSGQGQVCRLDPATGKLETLLEVAGFTRGMTFCGPLLIVGLSKVRQSDVTRPAPLARRHQETFSGLWIFNLDTQQEVGHIRFTGNVDQIYDVAVLPDCHFPEFIEPSHPRMRNHFSHPGLQN